MLGIGKERRKKVSKETVSLHATETGRYSDWVASGFTLYALTPACKFSLLFSIHFLRC